MRVVDAYELFIYDNEFGELHELFNYEGRYLRIVYLWQRIWRITRII